MESKTVNEELAHIMLLHHNRIDEEIRQKQELLRITKQKYDLLKSPIAKEFWAEEIAIYEQQKDNLEETKSELSILYKLYSGVSDEKPEPEVYPCKECGTKPVHTFKSHIASAHETHRFTCSCGNIAEVTESFPTKQADIVISLTDLWNKRHRKKPEPTKFGVDPVKLAAAMKRLIEPSEEAKKAIAEMAEPLKMPAELCKQPESKQCKNCGSYPRFEFEKTIGICTTCWNMEELST